MTNSANKLLKNTIPKVKSSGTSESLLPTPNSRDHHAQGAMHNPKAHSTALSTLIEKKLIFSQVDSLANLSPKPDEEKERKMTASSGERCLGLLKNSDLVGSLAKMLLASSQWQSTKVGLMWKPKNIIHQRTQELRLKKLVREGKEGKADKEYWILSWTTLKVLDILSSRLLFQLSPSMHRTGEIGSGLLPTARSSMKNGASQSEIAQGNPKGRLETEIAMLKTPSASEGIGGAKTDDKYWNAKAPKLKLRDQIARAGMLPTPRAYDNGQNRNFPERGLSLAATLKPKAGTRTGLKLQPNFVEWMMGYPLNWTDLNSQNPNTESKDSKR